VVEHLISKYEDLRLNLITIKKEWHYVIEKLKTENKIYYKNLLAEFF
jgi:hypothetical protein